MVTHQKIYNLNHMNINNYKNITDFSEFLNNNDKFLKITAKKYTLDNNIYTIVKYNKSNLDKDDYNTLGLARSIIINNGKIICFSPPKSLDYNNFIENNPCNECFAEDFIDGTMINLFYDENINDWQVATRSTIGANTQFFVTNETHKTSFRDMFFEACKLANFEFNLLDNKLCYSFVLQHPNNRIVTPIDYPKIFFIRAYNINNDTNLITEVSFEVLFKSPSAFLNTNILYPQRYPIDNYDNLSLYYNNEQTPFYCVGVVINSKIGRSKIRNQNYENIRELRGNQSRLMYHYLTLRKNSRVKDFLTFYGEFKEHFSEYRKIIHDYTNNLYSNYIKCFIQKQQQLKLFSYEFKVHMFNLHQKYLSEIKPLGGYIDKKYVIDYFNGLHPSQQMHILNCKKKYNLGEKLKERNNIEVN